MLKKLTGLQRKLLEDLSQGVKVEVIMTPLVYVNGKQVPFAPFLHLHQLGLLEVHEGKDGVQLVKLTDEGRGEVETGKRIAQTVKHLRTFKQLELV